MMTTADMASALDEVQAKLAAAHLVAEWFHGIDSRDLDRAMATWHPLGVSSFTSGPVLEGSNAIRAWLEKAWARYAEVYHWVTNLSLTVRGGSTMHGEGRITALCVTRSGTAIREVGTIALDYTRAEGTWLISREAVTIQRREPAA
jgi:hypothetical protein